MLIAHRMVVDQLDRAEVRQPKNIVSITKLCIIITYLIIRLSPYRVLRDLFCEIYVISVLLGIAKLL